MAVAAFFFGNCTYDKGKAMDPSGDPCSGIKASYAGDIQPIISSSCAVPGCHNAGSTNAGGPITSYEQVRTQAANIKAQVVSRNMPRGSSLSAAQIRLISCWADSGAPNN